MLVYQKFSFNFAKKINDRLMTTSAEMNSEDELLKRFLEMGGIWSETEEGEEYYQMMKHRNDGRPANREVNLDD